MAFALYVSFVVTVIALMLIPGPNVALIVATSLERGPRAGFATVAGTSAAMVPQLALTGLGIGAVLAEAGEAFRVLRWLGVAYLLWLAYRAFRACDEPLGETRQNRPLRTLFMRGFLVSLSNPKTLIFFGAFFPQFIDVRQPIPTQVMLLSVTFLMLAALVDSGWALMAARAGRALRLSVRLRNRLTGGIFLGAGLGLALTRNAAR